MGNWVDSECGWWHVQAWICGLPYLNRPRQIRFGMSREQSQDRWCRIFSFPAFGMCLQALRLHQHPRSQLTPSSFSPLIRRAQRPRVSMIAATTRPPGGDAQQVLKKEATCSRCGVTEPIEKFHVGRRDQLHVRIGDVCAACHGLYVVYSYTYQPTGYAEVLCTLGKSPLGKKKPM